MCNRSRKSLTKTLSEQHRRWYPLGTWYRTPPGKQTSLRPIARLNASRHTRFKV